MAALSVSLPPRAVRHLIDAARAHGPHATRDQILQLIDMLTRRGLVQVLPPGGEAETGNPRYARQTSYFGIFENEIGGRHHAQERLSTSKVAIVGVGGVGNWTAQHLAAVGIGTLVLVDGDTIERSNLNRQSLYSEADLGQLKVEVAERELKALNSEVKIRPVARTITSAGDLETVLAGTDLFVLTADKPHIVLRRWASDVSMRLGIPWLHGSVDAYLLQLGPLYVPGQTACYCCRELEPKNASQSAYAEAWIQENQAIAPLIAPACAMVGSVIAMEAVRFLGQIQDSALSGRYVKVDMRTWRSTAIDIHKHPNCSVCGPSHQKPLMGDDLNVAV
jgi:molybdopterin-synthase adenylyltransferase